MALDRDDVLHVAKLANLALSDAEVEQLQHDLQDILAYVQQLDELDTSNVPPTEHMAVEQMPLAADERAPSLDTRQVLSQAARVGDGGFAVPGFVDE